MKKRKILHALTYAVLTLGALLVFFPFYLTVVSSLKDMSDFSAISSVFQGILFLTILLMYSRDRIISSH